MVVRDVGLGELPARLRVRPGVITGEVPAPEFDLPESAGFQVFPPDNAEVLDVEVVLPHLRPRPDRGRGRGRLRRPPEDRRRPLAPRRDRARLPAARPAARHALGRGASAPQARFGADGSAGGTRAVSLYLFDEPTTGLHPSDSDRLLGLFAKLLVEGHTIIAVEHDLDLISRAGHVIDLGPEGGDSGGSIIVQGTPEAVAACRASYTGAALRKFSASGHR